MIGVIILYPVNNTISVFSDRSGSGQEQAADGERLREAQQQEAEGPGRAGVHRELGHDAQGLQSQGNVKRQEETVVSVGGWFLIKVEMVTVFSILKYFFS